MDIILISPLEVLQSVHVSPGPDNVFKDRRLLAAALADLGYTVVEEGDALLLCGY